MRITRNQLRRFINETIKRALTEGDPWAEMDASFEAIDTPEDKSQWPKDVNDEAKARANVKAMADAIASLGTGADAMEQEMAINLKYGLEKELNGAYIFNTQDGNKISVR